MCVDTIMIIHSCFRDFYWWSRVSDFNRILEGDRKDILALVVCVLCWKKIFMLSA